LAQSLTDFSSCAAQIYNVVRALGTETPRVRIRQIYVKMHLKKLETEQKSEASIEPRGAISFSGSYNLVGLSV
jgi:hypothetical protein